MALHGLINVNTDVIGGWTAVRRPGNAQPYTYDCDVMLADGKGRVTFTLTHNYDDGAVKLAALILAEAAEYGL